ncbi:MAG: tetratricopeptide repeat protein, partial [Bacteroidota bacterium]
NFHIFQFSNFHIKMFMKELILKAQQLRDQGDFKEALKLLDQPSLKEDAEAAFLAGEIHYNNQNWGDALNSFRHCLQIDPAKTGAQTYVDLILNILGFFYTDQFNP